MTGMDEIYRFRSIDRLFGETCELERQTIYFAESSELNDPMEAIRDLVWRGDKIVWANLFRHYLYCLHHIYFLVRITEHDDPVDPADIPINMRWDDPPTELYADVLNDIWDDVNRHFDLEGIASRLDSLGRAVRRDELEFYLRLIQVHAVAAVVKTHVAYGLQEPDLTDFEPPSALPGRFPQMFDLYEQLSDDERFLEASFEVMHQMWVNRRIQIKMSAARQDDREFEDKRNLFLVDFPHAYVQELPRAVGPVWSAACFTDNYGNSALWSSYAEGHSGVCLVFAVDDGEHGPSITLHEAAEGDRMAEPELRPSLGTRKHTFEPVRYVESLDEVDFFARINRLPEASARAVWFTDGDGNVSSSAVQLAPDVDINAWRDDLWSEYRRDILAKTKEWAHEHEHRLVTYSLLSDTLPSDERTMTYDFSALKGIIFGIDTDDDDKIRIIDLVKRKCVAAGRAEFDFRQARYSWRTRQVESFPLNLSVTQ